MSRHILNLDAVVLEDRHASFVAPGEAAERFDAQTGQIASRLCAQKLGYNLTVVPPGKRAFPLHNHHINEEMFLILAGEGTLRIGPTTHAVRSGDVIACPPGDKSMAHQLINTGTEDLRYLAVSTKLSPEIAEYPDSGKFCAVAEYPADWQGAPKQFHYFGREDSRTPYWDGE